jgi:hypothetical protein
MYAVWGCVCALFACMALYNRRNHAAWNGAIVSALGIVACQNKIHHALPALMYGMAYMSNNTCRIIPLIIMAGHVPGWPSILALALQFVYSVFCMFLIK